MGSAALGFGNSGMGTGNLPVGLLLGAPYVGKGEKTTRTAEVNVKRGKEG